MSTGPVTPLPQEPQVHDKRNMFGQRARYPISWAIRSVLRVFAEGSFISGGGARTEGQLPPFRVARRFTPRRCLSSRASYPLPRASSDRPHGRLIQFPVQVRWGQSTPSVHGAQNAQERRTLKRAERSRAQNAQERRTIKGAERSSGLEPRARIGSLFSHEYIGQ